MNSELKIKYNKLLSLILEYLQNGLCLALSGGVDSGLLAGVTARLLQNKTVYTKTFALNFFKNKFYAVTFKTPLYSDEEIFAAKKLCKELKINHFVIPVDMEKMPKALLKNPKDRCFICKKAMFKNVIKFCKEKKLCTIIDGTNFDDLSVYRPGKKALEELNIKSPLAECGFTKNEIRSLAEELELNSIAKKPSAPCFATRLPYGTFLDIPLLKKIEESEKFLHKSGFAECRIRFHNPVVRIEIPENLFTEFLEQKKKIISKIKSKGFKYITLDIEGLRSGSMDE